MELNMTEDTNRQFKPLIQDKELPELKKWMADHGEPAYRAGQVFSWVHGKQVTSFDAMTNLSKSLRAKLAEDYDAAPLAMVQRQISEADGTNKFLYRLRDGQCIETVFMPYHHGNSVCVSSQAGCSMGCTFCASTIGGKVRDPDGQNMSMRNITLSTCGIVPGIYRLAEEKMPITLALSLHAPTQEKREKLMPIARRYHLDEVMRACDDYREATGRRETFEYALVAGVNDTDEDVRELAQLLKGRSAHVNLIPVNPVRTSKARRPERGHVLEFQKKLEKSGINGTIRREMGADIDGACGQLRRRQGV